jgi:hypothetical protein
VEKELDGTRGDRVGKKTGAEAVEFTVTKQTKRWRITVTKRCLRP